MKIIFFFYFYKKEKKNDKKVENRFSAPKLFLAVFYINIYKLYLKNDK